MWINFTVPTSSIKELVALAHHHARVASTGDDLGADEARVKCDALITALATILGDSSGCRRAIVSYLHLNLGGDDIDPSIMTENIIGLAS